jgi:hypothetical protein
MLKRFLIPVLAGRSILPLEAGAWVGYHGGGFARGPYGGTAAWHRAGWGGAWHGAAWHGWGYHGATVYHGGCWGCAGAAGAAVAAGAVGLAAGAAIGSAAAAASTPTVVVQQPVYVASPALGSVVVSLPGNCASTVVIGVTYYNCGGVYYQPSFGSNGVYYTVVQNPAVGLAP